MKPTTTTIVTRGKEESWEVADVRTHNKRDRQKAGFRFNSITEQAQALIQGAGAYVNKTHVIASEFAYEAILSQVNYTLQAIRPVGSIGLPWISIVQIEGTDAIVFDCINDRCLTLSEWQVEV